MRKNILLMLNACLLMALTSCIANKDYVYLQGATIDQLVVPAKVEYKIQRNDILSISIGTADQLANSLFNTGSGLSTYGNYGGMGSGMGGGMGGNSFYFSGYSIDDDGYIKIPIIGKLKVIGLSIKQVKTLVEKEADKFFTGYFIKVQLAGINYSIMGEVRIPGSVSVLKNQHNLLEALAMSGDLTPLANRKHIQIIRQYPDGLKIHEIDLTQVSVISSPYFLIQPNDLIYIPPIKRRESGFGVDGLTSISQTAAIIGSVVAVFNGYFLIQRALSQ
jgi:polysaccharide export outer membrane protein